MEQLKSLSEELKQQAFEKAKLGLKLNDGVLVRINENKYKEALNITQHPFLKDETVHSLSGVIWGPEIEEYWTNLFRQNWSIMIIDEDNGVAMGILTMKYETEDDKYSVNEFTDPGMKHVVRCNGIGEAKGNIYEHFNVKDTIHIISLCVAEKYRRRGIGTKLVQAAIELVKELKVKSGVCLKVEGSSNYSKKIFENSCFETLSEFPFDEYMEDGEQIFKNIGIHKSMKMYGMMLHHYRNKQHIFDVHDGMTTLASQGVNCVNARRAFSLNLPTEANVVIPS